MQVIDLLDLPGKDNLIDPVIQLENANNYCDDLLIQKRRERVLDWQGMEENLQDDRLQQ